MNTHSRIARLLLSGLILLTGITSAQARDALSTRTTVPGAISAPNLMAASHNVGAINMMIVNNGTIGDGYTPSNIDYFTGSSMRACEYPKGSNSRYLFIGALWIGAVVGTDTLVSVAGDGWTGGIEYYPDAGALGMMRARSTLYPDRPDGDSAVSHQDYLATFFDTCTNCSGLTNDAIDNRPHKPLGLRIDQKSYAWAYDYADDFVIIEFTLTNILGKQIRNGYGGFYVDADVLTLVDQGYGFSDDLCGFLSVVPPPDLPGDISACGRQDTMKLAWIADDNGELDQSLGLRVPHVTATEVLGVAGTQIAGFNWWASNGDTRRDFGPQGLRTFRDLGTGGTGTPEGDRNKYWFLRNGEFDYDQVYTASITPFDSIWTYPPEAFSADLSNGYDARYLISFGSFDLDSGQSVSFAIAYVGGMNLHTNPFNIANLQPGSYNPQEYYANLDFSDLITNAQWAKWIYDNPGVDSDSDGYAGEYTVCLGDTVWVTGDGVPDLVAADRPVEPSVTAVGDQGAIKVTWNGWRSETTPDRFYRRPDFEGYNVFLKRHDALEPYALVGSYDREDYSRIRFNAGSSKWEANPGVFSIEDLRLKYAGDAYDSTWKAGNFTKLKPFIWMMNIDSAFVFVPVGCNASRLGFETKIVKRYADAPKPPYASPAEVPPDEADVWLNELGQFKYYDYELTIDSLIPGQAYAVGVTAFDWGPGGEKFSPLSSDVATVQPVTPTAPLCCQGQRGNIDCDPANACDIGDLTALLDHLFLTFTPLCCVEAANLDESAAVGADIADLSALIDHLFISFGDRPGCR